MKEVIVPVADWVLFRQIIEENESGILLPEIARDGNLCKNVVVSIGEDVDRVNPGDEIIIMAKVASKLHFPERNIEKDLFIVKQENIIAVIKEA
jgi:co-chaperonin GroES (HSP10)